jgi:flagellar hook-basal body complex protein FliE
MMNIGAVTGVTSDYVIDFAKKNDLLGYESFQSVLDTAMEQID